MIYLMMIESQEDKDKFEFLYDEYRFLMYRIADEILHNAELSEDVVHDSFIKIAKNMDKIKDVKSKETKNYIIVITKNTALDAYRKIAKRRENEISVNEIEDFESLAISQNIDLHKESKSENKVEKVIRNMDEKYKSVFLLKYVNGLSYKEIAESLNISEEAVRKRISRGKDIIQKGLEGMEDE